MATFGKSRRFENNANQTPAPGSYNPKTLDKVPTAAVLGKPQEKNKENAPPVGHYSKLETKFARPPSSASSRSRNHHLKKSKRLSRSTSSLDAGSSVTGSSIAASSVTGSLASVGEEEGRVSPRIEELERDLEVEIQLNDQSEAKIAALEAENRRLKEETEKLSSELSEKQKDLEGVMGELEVRRNLLVDKTTQLSRVDEELELMRRKAEEAKLEEEERRKEVATREAKFVKDLEEAKLELEGKTIDIANLSTQLKVKDVAVDSLLKEKDDASAARDQQIRELNEKLTLKDDEYYELFQQRSASLEAEQKEMKELKAEMEKMTIDQRVATKLAEGREEELQTLIEQKRSLAEAASAKEGEISMLTVTVKVCEEKVEDLTCQIAIVEAKCEATVEANTQRFQTLIEQLEQRLQDTSAKAGERVIELQKEKVYAVEALQATFDDEKRQLLESSQKLEAQLFEMQEELNRKDENCRLLENQLGQIQESLDLEEEDHRQLEAQYGQLQEHLQQKQDDHVELETEFHQLQQQLKRKEEDHQELRTEFQQQQQQLLQKENDHQRLEVEYSVLQERHKLKEEAYQKLDAELIVLKEHLKLKADNCQELNAELNLVKECMELELEVEFSQLQQLLKQKKENFQQLEAEFSRQQDHLQQEVKAHQQLRADFSQLQERLNQKEENYQQLEAQLSQLQKHLESKEENRLQLEAQFLQLREHLVQATEDLQRESEEQRTQMKVIHAEAVFCLTEQFDGERSALMRELENARIAAVDRESAFRQAVEEREREKTTLAEKLQRKRNQMEGILKSQQTLQELMPKVVMSEKLLKEKNDLEQELFRHRLEAAQTENSRDCEKREFQAKLFAMEEEVQGLRKQVAATEAEVIKAIDKEDKMRRALAQKKEEVEEMEALRQQAETWKSKCEQLTELIGPFKSQLEQYGVERDTLMEQKNTTQKEFDRLADDFAKHMGHQNHKQKIHHLVTLKEEKFKLMQKNQELQMELAKLQAVHANCTRRH